MYKVLFVQSFLTFPCCIHPPLPLQLVFNPSLFSLPVCPGSCHQRCPSFSAGTLHAKSGFMSVVRHASAHLTCQSLLGLYEKVGCTKSTKCVFYRRRRSLSDGSRGRGYVQGTSHCHHFLPLWRRVYREGRGTGCFHKGLWNLNTVFLFLCFICGTLFQ